MKRKDTKIYKDIVDNYCYYRNEFEFQDKECRKTLDKINEAENIIKGQENNQLYEFAKSYISILKFTYSCSKNLYDNDLEYMKKYEEILINDYNDNVDLIYSTYKAN